MISMFLRDPQALRSTLASLGMLQPRAFGSHKIRRHLGLSLLSIATTSIVPVTGIAIV